MSSRAIIKYSFDNFGYLVIDCDGRYIGFPRKRRNSKAVLDALNMVSEDGPGFFVAYKETTIGKLGIDKITDWAEFDGERGKS